MEVRPGYKQTEVGIVPEQWEVKPLREVLAKARLGGNYANSDRETEFPLMKMGNIGRGRFDLTKVQFVSPGTTPVAEHRLLRGDVLFNTRNTLDLVGKVAIWRDELPTAYYNSNLLRLEFRPDVVCSNEYANLFFNTDGSVARLRALATGTTSVAAIYTRDLLGLAIVVPPLDEQIAIGAALNDIDALLALLDRLITKKRDLKQAAMQQLLTGQTRLPGFRGEWKRVCAGDIGCFRGGNGFPNRLQGSIQGDFPFYKVSDMNIEGNEIFMSEANNWISEVTRKSLGATAFPAGSIIFAKVGAAVFLERKKILTTPSCIDNNMAALVLDKSRAAVRFVHYALLNIKFGAHVSTTALPSLNGAVLAQIALSMPPLDEQASIASALSDMDAELTALEVRRDKTRALKQGMMQELLAGRTRLI